MGIVVGTHIVTIRLSMFKDCLFLKISGVKIEGYCVETGDFSFQFIIVNKNTYIHICNLNFILLNLKCVEVSPIAEK